MIFRTFPSIRPIALATFLALAQFAVWARGQSTQPTNSAEQHDSKADALQRKIDTMQQQMDAMQQQMTELRQQQNQNAASSSAQAKDPPPGSMNQENASSPAANSNDLWTVGYDQGFFLKQDDEFKIIANGLLDVRYTYAHAQNTKDIAGTALGTNKTGDMSGFNLNTGELSLSGILFHNIFFKVMGNYGTTASYTTPATGTFQLAEYYGGYSFGSDLNLRAGAFIIPFVPLRTLANYGGSQFPDLSDASVPFLAGYGLGADVFGTMHNQTISYDLMVGNGSNSQNAVDSTAPGADIGRDNRLSIYTREQYAGAGTVADFQQEEPDLAWHEKLAWILGAGLGWESQNSSANAFPQPQTTVQIPGLSAASGPGFVPTKYILDGDLFRAAADFRSKFQGWSTFCEVYYQNISSESGPIIPGSPRMNVGQIGYFLQTGYFLIPHKLDIAGRFSQLYTIAFPNHMDEYTLGLDYYLVGENMKVQLAETYIPLAALTSGNGSLVNTQNFITELQLQMKF